MTDVLHPPVHSTSLTNVQGPIHGLIGGRAPPTRTAASGGRSYHLKLPESSNPINFFGRTGQSTCSPDLCAVHVIFFCFVAGDKRRRWPLL